MSGYYLCTTPRAVHPYYIEHIGISIESIEELCYYLKENVYLIDETILNETLFSWLSEELGLKRLSSSLRHAADQEVDPAVMVNAIFEETGYLPPKEREYLRQQLLTIQKEDPQVRQKMKGDYLVHYGKYRQALAQYEGLLANRNIAGLGVRFYAIVLENMAAVYAKMFRFPEAADCLWESYETLRSKKVYEKYLRLLPLFLNESEYQEELERIRADRQEAERLRKDNEAIFAEALQSETGWRFEGKSREEQIEMLREEIV
ncbi:MAG: hypothetical protein Q4B01_03690 [Eubacteriales bacterium]|nr:hypothetical protein [Eubacteriales bacterium]